MIINNGAFPSIEQTAGQFSDNLSRRQAASSGTGKSFADVLIQKSFPGSQSQSPIHFSKHAAGRLNERNIEISDVLMNRLSAGTQAAREKGINETLVMVDQLAFIVNVKNSTVITAMDQRDADANVFTNIDGAVIA